MWLNQINLKIQQQFRSTWIVSLHNHSLFRPILECWISASSGKPIHHSPNVKSHRGNVRIDQPFNGAAQTVWCQRFILDLEYPCRRSFAATADCRWKHIMVIGNYSNRVCWWLTDCTHRKEKLLELASSSSLLVSSLMFPLFFYSSTPLSLRSPLVIPSALRFPLIFSFSRLPFSLHSSFTSSPSSLLSFFSSPLLLSSFRHPPPLPFPLLRPSSLPFLPCPAAERLQSEPPHLYPSPPLYNHPQNALMR